MKNRKKLGKKVSKKRIRKINKINDARSAKERKKGMDIAISWYETHKPSTKE